MFFDKALDLANVSWKAIMSDGNQILGGPQTYPKIDRNKLIIFELTHKGKTIFTTNNGTRIRKISSTSKKLLNY